MGSCHSMVALNTYRRAVVIFSPLIALIGALSGLFFLHYFPNLYYYWRAATIFPSTFLLGTQVTRAFKRTGRGQPHWLISRGWEVGGYGTSFVLGQIVNLGLFFLLLAVPSQDFGWFVLALNGASAVALVWLLPSLVDWITRIVAYPIRFFRRG